MGKKDYASHVSSGRIKGNPASKNGNPHPKSYQKSGKQYQSPSTKGIRKTKYC